MATMMAQKIMKDTGKSNINKIEYYEDSQKNIDDVLLKVCNSEQLIDIKPSNFELIIYKVANIGGEYKLEKIAC